MTARFQSLSPSYLINANSSSGQAGADPSMANWIIPNTKAPTSNYFSNKVRTGNAGERSRRKEPKKSRTIKQENK
jgi:hypothetical protein